MRPDGSDKPWRPGDTCSNRKLAAAQACKREAVGVWVICIAFLAFLGALAFSGCAPRPRCQWRGDIEVCTWDSRSECRDLRTGRFTECPR